MYVLLALYHWIVFLNVQLTIYICLGNGLASKRRRVLAKNDPRVQNDKLMHNMYSKIKLLADNLK